MEIELYPNKKEKYMKKILKYACFAFLMVFMFTSFVQAATYSQTKTINVGVGGAKFNLSETATFNTSSYSPWTYTNRKLNYAGGTMYPINSNVTAKTLKELGNGDINYATRSYTIKATNQSYKDFVNTTSLAWTFDSSSKTWK